MYLCMPSRFVRGINTGCSAYNLIFIYKSHSAMVSRAGTFLVLSFLHVCFTAPLPHPTFQQCRAAANLPAIAMSVLPGGGWDNLRNLDMGRVLDVSYTKCQTTEDGFYFIPDTVFVIPQKVTHVDTYAEIISSYLKQRSSTSASINIEGSYSSGFHSVNGRFSADYERVKTNQINSNSETVRVQIRNNLYTVKTYPDFNLDFNFVRQIEDIADAIANSQSRLATYLSEKMVADYGTHVITSVDAGASLMKEDYLYSSAFTSSDSTKTSIKASFGYKFLTMLSVNASVKYTGESSTTNSYDKEITTSYIEGYGGLPFYPGMSIKDWQESTRNNLVGIDRSGLPLQYAINTNNLPNLPEPIVNKVALSLQQAIERYYRVNTHPGCVHIDSSNFNFQANVDDNSCDGRATEFNFGGGYLTCETNASQLCQDLAQTNPDTGNYSCREPYQAQLLRTEVIEEGYYVKHCEVVFYSCGSLGFFSCRRDECWDVYHVRSAKVNIYWCYFNGPTDIKGYLFGGLYGNYFDNPITKTKSCPEHFTAFKLLVNDVMICVSKTDDIHKVTFGGFFSCESPNPLAGGQPRCPPTYSQHQAAISDGCEILFCVQSNAFRGNESLPLRRPPFSNPPNIGSMSNNRIKVMAEENQTWIKVGPSKTWTRATASEVQDVVRKYATDSADESGVKAGIGLGVIALISFIIAGVVLTVRWKKGLPLCKKSSHGGDIHSQAEIMTGAEEIVL